jgi:hypothetical protein
MIIVRVADVLNHSEEKGKIERMNEDLTKVIEDFLRAVDIEVLCNTTLSFQSGDGRFLMVLCRARASAWAASNCQDKPSFGPRCMEGTQKSLLDQIITWVTDPLEQQNPLQSQTFWIYGLPGIGKTSLAHSICARLHDREHLAGAFFCRRDDPNLSKPRNVLPTLIHKLTGIFPAF